MWKKNCGEVCFFSDKNSWSLKVSQKELDEFISSIEENSLDTKEKNNKKFWKIDKYLCFEASDKKTKNKEKVCLAQEKIDKVLWYEHKNENHNLWHDILSQEEIDKVLWYNRWLDYKELINIWAIKIVEKIYWYNLEDRITKLVEDNIDVFLDVLSDYVWKVIMVENIVYDKFLDRLTKKDLEKIKKILINRLENKLKYLEDRIFKYERIISWVKEGIKEIIMLKNKL